MLTLPSSSNMHSLENSQAQGETSGAVPSIPSFTTPSSRVVRYGIPTNRAAEPFHQRIAGQLPTTIESSRYPLTISNFPQNSEDFASTSSQLFGQPSTSSQSFGPAITSSDSFGHPTSLSQSFGQSSNLNQGLTFGLSSNTSHSFARMTTNGPFGQPANSGQTFRPLFSLQAEQPASASGQNQTLSNGQTSDIGITRLSPLTFGPDFLQDFFTHCGNCQINSKASSKCFQCNEYLCDTCVAAHKQVIQTKDHRIYKFNAFVSNITGVNFVLEHQFADGTRSRVVGAGRTISNSSGYSSSTLTSSSVGNSTENLQAENGRRTSLDQHQPQLERNESLEDLDLRRLLSNTPPGFPITSSPSSVVHSSVTPTSNQPLFSSNHMPLIPSSSNENLSASQEGATGLSSTISPANDFNFDIGSIPDLPSCLTHQAKLSLFCNDCMLPICSDCCQQNHRDHKIIFITEGIKKVKEMSCKLTKEIRERNLNLRRALDDLQRMCDRIDAKANRVAMEVKTIIKRFIAAFEAREEDVLRRVEQARQAKNRLISFQMDNIRFFYSKLARASDTINDPSKFSSPFEVMMANHQAFLDLKQADNLGPNIFPCEDDGISFHPPEDPCLQSVSGFGRLNISISPVSNAWKLYKQPMLLQNRLPLSLPDHALPAAKSRPIYGCPEFITVKDFGNTPRAVWGKPGSNNGEFCRPWGIAINRHGQIIIADRSNFRIQVFDSTGRFLFHFGSKGSEYGQFIKPAGVAVNPNDDIIVVDKDNHRVQVFDRNGEFLFAFGEKGHEIGQFHYPWDVAVDSVGNILVSDTRNHRIQLFQWNGIFIAKWGGGGKNAIMRLLDSPRGVAFDPFGNIIVTDFNQHRVIMIERSTSRVRFIGREGSERGQFSRPSGVCCDDRGWFAVVDSKNHRVQVFNERGEVMWVIGREGRDEGYLSRPSDICFDAEGHVMVMDFGNDRVQVF